MTPQLQAVPNPEQARAVVYVRISTKEQLQGEGDPDGYSIPAQRQACLRHAASLDASVAEVFVERGESARSADRPELQRILAYLISADIRYVIVHKVDRLARNRLDDVNITAQIQAAGAQLVSVTENIDETPSGALMHGIMSSIAEFYSRNLANEVIKGTQQKVAAGGTPNVAPLGYLNVRQLINGTEARTVVVDPERADHLKWAFETYASGDYSLRQLATLLEERGLQQRPTPKRAARPLPPNKLHEVLRNRYYIGYVTWRGVEYEGKHPAFVSTETFEQVQRVLAAHRQAGERSYRHQHYLSGSLYCGRCRSRLLYNVARGRRGDQYEYFMCSGRHSGRTSCDLPYVPVDQLEAAVQRQWDLETFPSEFVEELSRELLTALGSFESEREAERTRLAERVASIRRERYKWADKAMDGSVPSDIAREKQQQLAEQLLSTQSALERVAAASENHRTTIEALMSLLDRCGPAYARSDDKGRRDYNHAWFEGLDVDVDDEQTVAVVIAHRTDVLDILTTRRDRDLSVVVSEEQKRRQDQGSGGADGIEHVDVSNVACLVEPRGFEPLTFSMRRFQPVLSSS